VPESSCAEKQVQAATIGGLARQAIASACAQAEAIAAPGEVHSAFDKAWNLRLLPGSLISVVQHDVGCGPLFVVLTPDDSAILHACRPERGVPVRVRAQVLMVQTDAGHWLRIDLGSASNWWTPKHVANAVPPARLAENLEHAAAWLYAQQLLGGLCSFAPGKAGKLGITPISRAGERALAALEGAWRAVDSGDVSAAVEHLLTLVGLGPGLTPSGDDMLVGWFGALSLAEASYGGGWPWLGELQRGLAEGSQAGRTTELSQQWLNAAFVGQVPQRLSDVLCSLLATGPDDKTQGERKLETALSELTKLGATSGVDALAGGWLALSALLKAKGALAV